MEYGAVQCGFCTPGVVLAAAHLLDRNSNPTREQIREGLSGNLCRCSGYVKIVDAVEAAAGKIRKGTPR
jgi:carbon-monoxide dehydrogenase small subunit